MTVFKSLSSLVWRWPSYLRFWKLCNRLIKKLIFLKDCAASALTLLAINCLVSCKHTEKKSKLLNAGRKKARVLVR